MELLDGVNLLACTDVFDRLARKLSDGKRGTASGITVEFCHDEAVHADRILKRLGNVYGLLTDHCINYEELFSGIYGIADILKLAHELIINDRTSCGIYDQVIAEHVSCFAFTVSCDLNCILLFRIDVTVDSVSVSKNLKLSCSCGSVNVNRDDHGLLACCFKELCKLDCRSGLTCTLETVKDYRIKTCRRRKEFVRTVLASEEFRK